MAKQARRAKNKDNSRRAKRKVSVLNTDQIDYVDYKDVNLLKKFVSDRAKVRARRVTGNNAQQQREVALAIKNAREMALLPYTNRVTTQRNQRGDRGRGPAAERPARPTSDTPPPPPGSGPGEQDGEFENTEGEGMDVGAEATETAAPAEAVAEAPAADDAGIEDGEA